MDEKVLAKIIEFFDFRQENDDVVEVLLRDLCRGSVRKLCLREALISRVDYLNMDLVVYLNLSSCFHVFDHHLVELAEKTHKLKTLGLNQCAQLTDDGIMELIEANHDLENIGLDKTGITDSAVQVIGECVSDLRKLGMNDCSQLSSSCLQYLHQHTNMETLFLANCFLMDSSILGNPFIATASLVEIDLCGTSITDKAVLFLATKATNLKQLDVSSTLITDQALCQLGQHLLDLEDLTLNGCLNVTDDGVRGLQDLVHLACLNLTSCHRLSQESLHLIMNAKYKLKELYLKDTKILVSETFCEKSPSIKTISCDNSKHLKQKFPEIEFI